jgi:hypothetical protein
MGRAHARGLREERGRGPWLAGLRGRAGRLAAGPIGPNAKENSFPNKIWFLITAGLWEIVEGDLGGILT